MYDYATSTMHFAKTYSMQISFGRRGRALPTNGVSSTHRSERTTHRFHNYYAEKVMAC